jgi:hypothetical protein
MLGVKVIAPCNLQQKRGDLRTQNLGLDARKVFHTEGHFTLQNLEYIIMILSISIPSQYPVENLSA